MTLNSGEGQAGGQPNATRFSCGKSNLGALAEAGPTSYPGKT
jgi:hypothetical protein